MLRIHQRRVAWADAEEAGVESIDILDDAAAAHVVRIANTAWRYLASHEIGFAEIV